MKNNHLNRFATISTILALASASQGQTLYWDTDIAGNTLGNFGGSWNGALTHWNSDATGNVTGPLTADPASSDALVVAGGGATGVINLTIAESAASLSLANTANLAAFQISDGASLALTGAITDTGAGSADVRINNTSAANAATKLTASSVTVNVVNVTAATGGIAQFFTTGYDMTMPTQYSIGSVGGNTTVRQTAGTVTVNNAADRGFVFAPSSDNFANSSLYTTRYILDGGIMRANRIGSGGFDGNNNATNRWATTGLVEFNSGTVANFTNGTLVLQNGAAFGSYTGAGTKDMRYDTSKPLSIELAQTGTHTIDAAGASGRVIVTPSAQLVNKTAEIGTLAKTGLGNLILTGGGPVAASSYTGTTTVTAGKVMTDYSIIGGQAATAGPDSLSNAYSATSQLVLNGGNYELKGRSSADATSATGVTLPGGTGTGEGMYSVNVGATAGLVVGQSVTNANLPAGTYIRQILSGTNIQLSAMSTSTANQTDQTLDFGAGTFANTQTINSVDLQQAGNATTVTVTPGTGTSTTLLSFGDVSGSATGGFTKAGTGKLQLTGTVSYTGPTAINAGTLEFASASDQTITAVITGTASGTLVKSGAGILTINNAAQNNTFNGAVIVNGGTLANFSAAKGLWQASSFTVNSGILLSQADGLGFGGAMGSLTVNAGGTFEGGVQQLNAVTLNGGLINGTGSNQNVNFVLRQDVTVGGSSASIIQGNSGLALNHNTAAAGTTRTFNVADATGNADVDLTISNQVRDTYVSNLSTNLQKSGSGTLLLSGVNIYTGETIVLEGTLAVNGTSINNSTQLTLDGGIVDLTGAETVNTLFFGAVQQAAGTWGSSSSAAVAPFVDDTRFSGTGTLIVSTGPAPVSGYSAWQTANSTAQTADLDHDNDGVSNGVEHFLGGIANTTGNSNPLPGVINTGGTLSVTWVRDPGFPGFPGNYGTAFLVETSATLANPWTPAVEGVGAGFVEITGDSVKYTFPAGTKNFARLKIVP